jgi:hypothetical protein
MPARQAFAIAPPPAAVSSTLRDFSLNGRKTLIERRGGVPFYFNEFWTARQRQAHRLHEISYRACFKPQLPAFFIERLTRPRDCVYDPFMGRGTTPLQAALMDRAAIGNDVNPLSAMLIRPRLDPPSLARVAGRLKAIDWTARSKMRRDLLTFFHRRTLAKIEALRGYLLASPRTGGQARRGRRLDQNGRAQSADWAFAGLLLSLYPAAQPSDFDRSSAKD